MDRGVRAIVGHRLPNAEELNAGCGDWLECCQAYIHAEGCTATATTKLESMVEHGENRTETFDSLRAERDAWRRGMMLVLDELAGFEPDAAPHVRVRKLRRGTQQPNRGTS